MLDLPTIIQMKYPEEIRNGSIILQDDGQGVYIKEWNIVEPRPTEKQLSKWANELEIDFKQNKVRAERKELYLSWDKQLDMLYWDKVNGTNTWMEHVKSVKEAKPLL